MAAKGAFSRPAGEWVNAQIYPEAVTSDAGSNAYRMMRIQRGSSERMGYLSPTEQQRFGQRDIPSGR
jgi:hypothetical protein